MSYATRKEAMGDSISDLIKCASSAVGTLVGGAADPYLPEVFCRITQLKALTSERTPLQAMFGKKPTMTVPVCVSTPLGKRGIGVERAIKPLRAIVYLNKHPATVWLGLTALLAVPLLAGYMIGRRK
jgi:hypothetical protein